MRDAIESSATLGASLDGQPADDSGEPRKMAASLMDASEPLTSARTAPTSATSAEGSLRHGVESELRRDIMELIVALGLYECREKHREEDILGMTTTIANLQAELESVKNQCKQELCSFRVQLKGRGDVINSKGLRSELLVEYTDENDNIRDKDIITVKTTETQPNKQMTNYCIYKNPESLKEVEYEWEVRERKNRKKNIFLRGM